MKNMSRYQFILVFLLMFPHTGYPIVSSIGEIDNVFSYENLDLDIHTGYLKGTILNMSSIFQKDVRLRFDAYDNFKRVLWQTTVRIDFIKAKGKSDFRQLISRNKIESPLDIKCVNLNAPNEKKKGASSKEVVINDYLNTSSNRLPLYINGNGKKMSDLFELESGLIKATFEHNGGGYFSIWLMDQNGKRIELFIGKPGKLKGSSSANIPRKGKYFIEVNADPNADWSVRIEKPSTGDYHMTSDENKISIKKGKDGVTYLELND
jgi:hypothetical protein